MSGCFLVSKCVDNGHLYPPIGTFAELEKQISVVIEHVLGPHNRLWLLEQT